MSRILSIAAILFLFTGATCLAQKSNNPVNSDLYNTWYEWPHENTANGTVYKTTKYEPIPGIDKQDEPFSKLIIKNDGTFIKTQYCGYCPLVKLEENTGKADIKSTNGVVDAINVTYKSNSDVSPLSVVSLAKDKLIINFQHTINTK